MLKWFLNFVFPPKCIFCSIILDVKSDIFICEECYEKISFIGEGANLLKKGFNYYDDIVCVCYYSGIIKDALKRFKFSNKPIYATTFSRLLVQKLNEVLNIYEYQMIISVPLHSQKEAQRGYNQAYLISKELSNQLGVPEGSNFLKRIKNTNSQSMLDRKERIVNVKGAFSVNDCKGVDGKTILLCDDVLTTGSTLNECSRVLKDAGAKRVVAVVVASGRKF